MRNASCPEFLLGKHGLTNIAIMRNTAFSFSGFGTDPVIHFATSIIITADGNASGFYNNLTDDWTRFHSITFYGGNINSIFVPENALSYQLDGTAGIDFRPSTDYTHSIDFKLNDKNVTLTVSVYQSWSRYLTGRRGAHSLGELDTSICLSFEESQSFDNIADYYRIIKSLVSILIGQNNIAFDSFVCQKNKNNQNFLTATCKIFDSYENYARVNSFGAIKICDLFEYIPELIHGIIKNSTAPLQTLLPSNNKEINRISITNIQDMCTALEAAYPNKTREKDNVIEELKKEIKKTINDFRQSRNDIDFYKQTTLSSCFQYLDFNLRHKILTMYNENKEFIDPIIASRRLPPINEETVGEFVKLRNNKAHGGIVELGDCVQIYPALLAIVYVQLFKKIGIPDEKIEKIIYDFF